MLTARRNRAVPCGCVYQGAEGVRRRQSGSESLADDEPVKQHADRDKVLFYGRLGCCALYFARSVSPTATSNVRRDRSRASMRQGRPLQRCLHTTARVGPSLASTGGSTRCSALHYSADPPGFCFLILPQPLRGCSIWDLRTKSSMPLEWRKGSKGLYQRGVEPSADAWCATCISE